MVLKNQIGNQYKAIAIPDARFLGLNVPNSILVRAAPTTLLDKLVLFPGPQEPYPKFWPFGPGYLSFFCKSTSASLNIGPHMPSMAIIGRVIYLRHTAIVHAGWPHRCLNINKLQATILFCVRSSSMEPIAIRHQESSVAGIFQTQTQDSFV